jgi:hypothetical protein
MAKTLTTMKPTRAASPEKEEQTRQRCTKTSDGRLSIHRSEVTNEAAIDMML